MLATFTLKLCSYNSQGLAPDRQVYIDDLMKLCDVLLIQEHWLYQDQVNCFHNFVDNIHVHAVSGMDQSRIHTGRPYGGCAILWSRSIKGDVEPIQMNSNRVCGIRIRSHSGVIMLFNVYLPCDGSGDISMYNETLDHIVSACNLHDSDMIIVGGDFNTALNRTTSANTISLNNYLLNESCLCGINYIGA